MPKELSVSFFRHWFNSFKKIKVKNPLSKIAAFHLPWHCSPRLRSNTFDYLELSELLRLLFDQTSRRPRMLRRSRMSRRDPREMAPWMVCSRERSGKYEGEVAPWASTASSIRLSGCRQGEEPWQTCGRACWRCAPRRRQQSPKKIEWVVLSVRIKQQSTKVDRQQIFQMLTRCLPRHYRSILLLLQATTSRPKPNSGSALRGSEPWRATPNRLGVRQKPSLPPPGIQCRQRTPWQTGTDRPWTMCARRWVAPYWRRREGCMSYWDGHDGVECGCRV